MSGVGPFPVATTMRMPPDEDRSYPTESEPGGVKRVAACCEDESCEIGAMRERHSRVLWIVLVINATMFLVEGAAG